VLWPEEVYSNPQLEARLHKLLSRLRERHGAHVEVRGRTIRLAERSRARVSVTVAPEQLRPSFLATRASFASSELSEYYEIERSQRALRLLEWIDRGWIVSEGKGRAQRYRVAQ
jgi:hypothetical protein